MNGDSWNLIINNNMRTLLIFLLLSLISLLSFAGKIKKPSHWVASIGTHYSDVLRDEINPPYNGIFVPVSKGLWSPYIRFGVNYHLKKSWSLNVMANYSVHNFNIMAMNVYLDKTIFDTIPPMRQTLMNTAYIRLHYIQLNPELEYKPRKHWSFKVGLSLGYKVYDKVDVRLNYSSNWLSPVKATTKYNNSNWLLSYTFGVEYCMGKNRIGFRALQFPGPIYKTEKYLDYLLSLGFNYSRIINYKKRHEK